MIVPSSLIRAFRVQLLFRRYYAAYAAARILRARAIAWDQVQLCMRNGLVGHPAGIGRMDKALDFA